MKTKTGAAQNKKAPYEKPFHYDPVCVESCSCTALNFYSLDKRQAFCGAKSDEGYICTRDRNHSHKHHSHHEPGKVFLSWK